jgi:hypothetical protein
LSDLVKRFETSSFLAGERLERDVGCEAAHEGFGAEDDEDPKSTCKQKKREYSYGNKGIDFVKPKHL